MNVEIFTLCDAATVDASKLNILGAFDTIFVRELPTVHNQIAIALRLRIVPEEDGEHKFRLSFVDPDGNSLVDDMKIVLEGRVSPGNSSSALNAVFNLYGVELQELGEYVLDLAIDENKIASLPWFVKEAPGGMKNG